jgi:hypothetical protein
MADRREKYIDDVAEHVILSFQDFREWSGQISEKSIEQRSRGIIGDGWTDGSHLETSMFLSDRDNKHPDGRDMSPTSFVDELPYGLKLDVEEESHNGLRLPNAGRHNDAEDISTDSTKTWSSEEQRRKFQNRQAQRAFRERKLKHVQQLEMQIKSLLDFNEALKHENRFLRARTQSLGDQLRKVHNR